MYNFNSLYMQLSILIPTYNRAKFLIENLEMLAGYIRKGNFQMEVEIVVSNNHSTDNTDEKVKQFQKQNADIKFQYFTQNENIGLEKNAIFTLEKAISKYVMYLGDDDYLDENYLVQVLRITRDNKKLTCIIPSFVPITPEKERLEGGRDIDIESRLYIKGFYSTKENSYRGHQLSGLTFLREGLLEEYKKQKVQNIYPFIFFTAYSTLIGETYHFTDYPIKVTQPGQDKKDWGYGKDGLMNEIFDNYKKLPVTYLQKTLLELKHYRMQDWRLWMYKSKGNAAFYKAFVNIWLSRNSTVLFKIIFPMVFFIQIVKKVAIRIFHVIHS